MILLDASAIIFLMEGTADTQAAVRTALHESFSEPPPPLAVSALSRLECRVRPLRDDNQPLLGQYDAFLKPPTTHSLTGIESRNPITHAAAMAVGHRLESVTGLRGVEADFGRPAPA